jgi:hypothetical protein
MDLKKTEKLGFNTFSEYKSEYCEIVKNLVEIAPALKTEFLESGSAGPSIHHLAHTLTWDIELHTREANKNPIKVVQQFQKKFGKNFELYEKDQEFGIYRALLKTNHSIPISLDIFSSYETVKENQIEHQPNYHGLASLTLKYYLEKKIECLEGREETKDIVHLAHLYQKLPKEHDNAWNKLELQTMAKTIILLEESFKLKQTPPIEGQKTLNKEQLKTYSLHLRQLFLEKQKSEFKRLTGKSRDPH